MKRTPKQQAFAKLISVLNRFNVLSHTVRLGEDGSYSAFKFVKGWT